MYFCPRGRSGTLHAVLLTFLIPLWAGFSLAADTSVSDQDFRLRENEFRLVPSGAGPLQLAHGFVVKNRSQPTG